MADKQTTVFVLGAGFTRAFAPRSPLLIDDFDISDLQRMFRRFRYASRLLELEFNRPPSNVVDIERLMTRLESGMPYDAYEGSRVEIAALASELRKVFRTKLSRIVVLRRHQALLARFATHLVESGSHVVTFNYDDVIDQYLWRVRAITRVPGRSVPYWHPDGGYGFFCRPGSQTIEEQSLSMDQTSMHVLKLHGSMNWRVRRGTSSIAPVDAVMHFEDWLPHEGESGLPVPQKEDIELHLDPEPLWIPPVLLKSAITEQPVLGLVWHRAFEVLHEAQRVVFIGYSLPVTDIAARTLFEEALEDLPPGDITVVSLTGDPGIQENLIANYRWSFGNIPDAQFQFGGAVDWIRESLGTRRRS